jgi:hypothetical protein
MVHTVIFIPGGTLLTLSNRIQDGQEKLQKKGWGQLIHVSDFVEEENGRLIVCNEEGDVVKNARCVIYPGMGTHTWWDHMHNSSCNLTK